MLELPGLSSIYPYMATQLSVCNSALAMIGDSRVTSTEFTAGTLPRVIEVKEQFWLALDELLRSHLWPFAKARETLSEGDEPEFGWEHSFDLPEGFITIISLNEADIYSRLDYFEIEGSSLLTDETEAKIVFIKRPDEDDIDEFLSFMDPLAVTAFITLLAAKVATKQTDGQEKSAQLLNRYYNYELPRARTRSANETKRPVNDPDSRWMASRWTSTNG